MLRYLFDTDHLTLFENGHQLVVTRFAAQLTKTIGISAVTVQESLRGRLGSLARNQTSSLRVVAYANLVATVQLLCRFPIVAYDSASDRQFQNLRTTIRQVGTQDLKIAAVALVNNLTLLTRNRRDFARVPGLALDDWSI